MHTGFIRRLNGEAVTAVLLAAGLLCFSLFFRVAASAWPAAVARRAEALRYERLIAGSSGFGELKGKIQERRSQLAQRLSTLTAGMGDRDDLSGLLQAIFDKAFEAGIRIDRTEPQPETRVEDMIHYPVLLEMTTAYHKFGTFISLLEHVPQAMRVDRVALTVQRDKTIEARLLVTCFVNARD